MCLSPISAMSAGGTWGNPWSQTLRWHLIMEQTDCWECCSISVGCRHTTSCLQTNHHFLPMGAHQGAPVSHLSEHSAHVGVGGTNLHSSVSLHLARLELLPAEWRALIPSQAFLLLLSCSKTLFGFFSSSFCLHFFPCSFSPLMTSSKQMVFKLSLFQEIHSVI